MEKPVTYKSCYHSRKSNMSGYNKFLQHWKFYVSSFLLTEESKQFWILLLISEWCFTRYVFQTFKLLDVSNIALNTQKPFYLKLIVNFSNSILFNIILSRSTDLNKSKKTRKDENYLKLQILVTETLRNHISIWNDITQKNNDEDVLSNVDSVGCCGFSE